MKTTLTGRLVRMEFALVNSATRARFGLQTCIAVAARVEAKLNARLSPTPNLRS
ncbi:hypothetical protein [Erythrobacter aureus]|uniref:hypothetical protein n=1 Tax=Erythrobacter aureus TaxID=2182384 RepID=UPI0013B3E587|nr:hypothetical protein [Erythrobacter aureus]